MTDQFCFALLRTTALQILQSAGFDSAHSDPTNSLTDILSQYIQLLASTTSSYAQLAGRSTGNIRDVVDGLDELGVTPESLKEWLELEGKALMPSWTPQSDPGRTLEEVVRNGRSNHDDALVYEYKDIPSDNNNNDDDDEDEENDYDKALDYLDSEVEEEDEEKEIIPKGEKNNEKQEDNNGLPDYIPPYLPRFPSSVKEDATPPPRVLPQVMPSITRQSSPGNTAVPAPIIVRHRKKPVENPFTHVVPFEESALAADKGTTLLSLRENEENNMQQQDQQDQRQSPASKRRRVALNSLPMKKAMESLADKEQQERRKQQRQALAGNHAMFRKFTQDEAAPGNTMFGNSTGVLEELLRRVAPPAMISKLSSPNLLVDVAMTSTPAPASNPTSSGATPAQQESAAIRPSSSGAHGNNNNNNISNSGAGASNINNTSMLATLAGGQYNRKHSHEETITVSTYTSTTSTPTLPFSSSASPLAAATAVAPQTSATTTSTPAAVTSIPTSTTSPTQRPISLASLSSGGGGAGGADGGKTSGKSKSGEKKLNERKSGERKSGERKSSEKGSEKKKVPKLTLNLSNGNNGGGGGAGGYTDGTAPSTAENTPSSATSVNTPKIRFKIKRPEPANEKIDITSTDDMPPLPPSSSSSTPPAPTAPIPAPASTSAPISAPPVTHGNGEEVQEEIVRCICDHPTIDYGTFMISCDKCHVWYHGECVNIAESDKVETWYCRNCK